MKKIILTVALVMFGGCSLVKVPVKVAKAGVKGAAAGVKVVGKGVKAVVD